MDYDSATSDIDSRLRACARLVPLLGIAFCLGGTFPDPERAAARQDANRAADPGTAGVVPGKSSAE